MKEQGPDISSTEQYMDQKTSFFVTILFLLSIVAAITIQHAIVLLGAAISMIISDIKIAYEWNKEFSSTGYAPLEPVKSALFTVPVFSILFSLFIYFSTPFSFLGSLVSSVIFLSVSSYIIFYIAIYQTTFNIKIGTNPLDSNDTINKIWIEQLYIERLEKDAIEKQE